MNEKTPKKTAKKTVKKKTTNKTREVVLTQPKDEVEKTASKLALELAARMELKATEELSSIEEEIALSYGAGYTKQEIIEAYSITEVALEVMFKKPAFLRKANENVIKVGMSDKNERIRALKQKAKWINDAINLKGFDGFKDLGITTLMQLLQTTNSQIAELVDKKEEDNSKKDISIMIVNHFKEKNGKEYNDIDDVLNERKYPTIDAEVINVTTRAD